MTLGLRFYPDSDHTTFLYTFGINIPEWYISFDSRQNIRIMHIISEKTLRTYWEKNRNAEPFLRMWIYDVENAIWESPQDLKKDFPKASILSNNRTVFRLNGNHLRVVTAIRYAYKKNQGTVFIRFVGSHSDYDKIDANTI